MQLQQIMNIVKKMISMRYVISGLSIQSMGHFSCKRTDAQDSIYDLENKKRDAMRAYDNDI